MVTVKDVAAHCGVSASTVSHVLNRTRRVCPETEQIVHQAVRYLGYTPLRRHKLPGKQPALCILLSGSIINEQANIISGITQALLQKDIRVFTIFMPAGIRFSDILQQQRYYPMDFCIVFSDGLLALPTRNKSDSFAVPTLFFDQAPPGHTSILRDYEKALRLAATHLLRRGHQEVEVLCGQNVMKHRRTLVEAMQDVFLQHGLHFKPGSLYAATQTLVELPRQKSTTALLTVGSDATSAAIGIIKRNGIEVPGTLSLITVGDNAQIKACFPEYTRLEFPIEAFARAMEKHMAKKAAPGSITLIEPQLAIGDSVLSIPRSPAGHKAASARALILSSSELARVEKQNFTACMVLNNGSTMFSQLMLQGAREMMESLNMQLIALGDAKGNFERHAMLLRDFSLLRSHALISVSNDHAALQSQLETVAGRGIPLVLGTDVPANMKPYTYGTCVATNEPQKGRMAARYLAQQMQAEGKTRIGFLLEGNRNFSARQRDESALSTIEEEFPQLEVLFLQNLPRDTSARQTILECLQRHPDVEGLYIYHAHAAILAHDLLREMGRPPTCLITTQLNRDIAQQLAGGDKRTGIASSQPYEMGRYLALACANLLLGHRLPPYVAIDPVLITSANLDSAWITTAKSKLPTYSTNRV